MRGCEERQPKGHQVLDVEPVHQANHEHDREAHRCQDGQKRPVRECTSTSFHIHPLPTSVCCNRGMGLLSGLVDAVNPSGKSIWNFAANTVDNAVDIGKGLGQLVGVGLRDLGTLATEGTDGDFATDDVVKALPSAIWTDIQDRYLDGDILDEMYERPVDFGLDALGVFGAASGAGLAGKALDKAGLAVLKKTGVAPSHTTRYTTARNVAEGDVVKSSIRGMEQGGQSLNSVVSPSGFRTVARVEPMGNTLRIYFDDGSWTDRPAHGPLQVRDETHFDSTLQALGQALGSRSPESALALSEAIGGFNPALVGAGDEAAGVLSSVALPLGRKGKDVTVTGLKDYVDTILETGKPGVHYGQADPARAIRETFLGGQHYIQDTPMRADRYRGRGKVLGDAETGALLHRAEQAAENMPDDVATAFGSMPFYEPGTPEFNLVWDWLLSEDPKALSYRAAIQDKLQQLTGPDGLLRLYRPGTALELMDVHERGKLGVEGVWDPDYAEMGMHDIAQMNQIATPTLDIFDLPPDRIMALGLTDNVEPHFLAPGNLWTPDGKPHIKGLLDTSRRSGLFRRFQEMRREEIAARAQRPLRDVEDVPPSSAHVSGADLNIAGIQQMLADLGLLDEAPPAQGGWFHGGANGAPDPDAPSFDPFLHVGDNDAIADDLAARLQVAGVRGEQEADLKLRTYLDRAIAANRLDNHRALDIHQRAMRRFRWVDEDANAAVPHNLGAVDRIPGPEALQAAVATGEITPEVAAARGTYLGGYTAPKLDELNQEGIAVEELLDQHGVMGGKHRITLPDDRRFFFKPGQTHEMGTMSGSKAEIMSRLGDIARPGTVAPVRAFDRQAFLDEKLRNAFSQNMDEGREATVQPWIEGAEPLEDFLRRGGVVTPDMVTQMLETTPLNALTGQWDIQSGNYMVRYVGPGQGPGGQDYVIIPIDQDLALDPSEMFAFSNMKDVALGNVTGQHAWNSLGQRNQRSMVVDQWPLNVGISRVNPDHIVPNRVYQAAVNLQSLGPEGIKDLMNSVFSRSVRMATPQAQNHAKQIVDTVAERLPYLPEYIEKVMKGRPDNIGTAFRERGSIELQMLLAPIAGAIGLATVFHSLTGDSEPGTIPHEQAGVVFDYLRDGANPDALFDAYKNGKISLTSKPFQRAIEKVEAMSDDEFMELMVPYALENGIDPNDMLDRKHNVRKNLIALIGDIKREKADITGIFAEMPTFVDTPDPRTGAIIRTEQALDFPQLDPEGVGPKDLTQVNPDDRWSQEQFAPLLEQMPADHLQAMKYLESQGIPKRHGMTLLRKKFPTMSPATMELFYDRIRKGEM